LVYRRKLSREEAASGRPLLLKSAWRLFPKPPKVAVLQHGGGAYRAGVQAEDCACVPPAHQHYYLALGSLAAEMGVRPGNVAELERRDDGSFDARLAS